MRGDCRAWYLFFGAADGTAADSAFAFDKSICTIG